MQYSEVEVHILFSLDLMGIDGFHVEQDESAWANQDCQIGNHQTAVSTVCYACKTVFVKDVETIKWPDLVLAVRRIIRAYDMYKERS